MPRLPETHEYHATTLRGMCLRPMWFRHAYPDAGDPPSSLSALGGTLGHKILGEIHLGHISGNLSPDEYTRMMVNEIMRAGEALYDPAAPATFDDTGRSTWLECETVEVNDWIAKELPKIGRMITQYGRYWRQYVDEDMTKGVVAIEAPYAMEIKSKGAPYRVTGHIDFIVDIPDVGRCLFDWKFGGYQRSHMSQGMLAMDYQLCTYALACRDGIVEGVKESFVPAMAGLLMMEDLLPYEKRTPVSIPRYPTESRRRWLEALLQEGKSVFMPGDIRGPLVHDVVFTAAMLDQHRDEMRARMAATRTGGGLVRVRGEQCMFCFFKDVCLDEWVKPRKEMQSGESDD